MSAILTCGLSPPEVRDRVAAGQVNTPPPAPGRTIGQIPRANVLTRFNAILGSLFVVVVIVGPPQDALFGLILAVNTGVGVAQELRAKRALDKLAILTAARARVLRGGAIAEISQDEVVQDDVLYLRRGDQVPVARVVLLDGTFAAIPQLLDEARRVIVNIERVAGLFVTKTAYAAILAVAVGAAGISASRRPLPGGRDGAGRHRWPHLVAPLPAGSLMTRALDRPGAQRWPPIGLGEPRCRDRLPEAQP